MQNRSYRIDNLRAIAIFAVVLGHLLERVSFACSSYLYLILYAFHMPLFAFLSGCCFKAKPRAFLRNVALPYTLFQLFYLLENAWEMDIPLQLQFTTPVWTMWYLLALMLWQVVTTFLMQWKPTSTPLPRIFWQPLPLSLLLALTVGFDRTIGYPLSLSRAIVFYPFYWGGVMVQQGKQAVSNRIHNRKMQLLWPALGVAVVLYLLCPSIPADAFYGSKPYESWYFVFFRALQYVSGTAFIVALSTLVPNRRIPLLTKIGQRTLPVYLLHGLCIRVGFKLELFTSDPHHPVLYVLASTTLMVLVFASKPFAYLFGKAKQKSK